MFNEWLSHVSQDHQEILKSMSEAERHDAFYTSLAFGTGGIRGKVGLGPNRMSVYKVRKIMVGYGQFLNQQGKKTVAIFNDNRQLGREFVQEAVNVLATFGITSYCYDELRPTPLLSFTIRYLNLDAGINFTASHNPKEYQGIKLYDETGCQYIPSQIDSLLPLIDQASYFDSFPAATYQKIDASVEAAYLSMISQLKLQDAPLIKTVYTPLHGTGSTLIQKIFPTIIPVEEQMVVDPYFTTVDYPNPEFESAYEYAYKTAKAVGAKLVIASDPDADRIGCSVLHEGAYRFLSGNEIAVLILDYLTQHRKVAGGVDRKSVV
jgi:phosphoglucomutase